MINIFRIASRIAGKSLLLMEEMGYNPYIRVDNISYLLPEECSSSEIIESIFNAWIKSGFSGDSLISQKKLFDTPSNFLHEIEHLVLDPNFDLRLQAHKSKLTDSPSHHGIESMMEEVMTQRLFRFILPDEADCHDAIDNSIWFSHNSRLENDKLLDMISSAPMSNSTLENIRDSAIYKTKQKYENGEINTSPDRPGVIEMNVQILIDFLMNALSKFDIWKEIISDEQEEKWRKFALNLRNEFKKLSRIYGISMDWDTDRMIQYEEQ